VWTELPDDEVIGAPPQQRIGPLKNNFCFFAPLTIFHVRILSRKTTMPNR